MVYGLRNSPLRIQLHIGAPRVERDSPPFVAFEQYCRQHSLSYVFGRDMSVRVFEDDARAQGLLEVLETYGIRPKPDGRRVAKADYPLFVSYIREHVYDIDDWRRAKLLQIVGAPRTVEYPRVDLQDSDGSLVFNKLPSWCARANTAWTGIAGGCALISERACSVLAEAGLRHLKLASVQYRMSPLPGWWELDSDLVLPRVSDTMEFSCRGRPSPWIDDSPLPIFPMAAGGVWRYKSSSIRSVESFDIARAVEPFGRPKWPRQGRSALIVSNRFFEVCHAAGFEFGWIPVAIEPD